jgi:adenosylcobinamide kinase / adenosylcobinamide-phosphate guanylyltransferase
MKTLTLILGGARSGKSSFAQKLAGSLKGSVVYVATATAGDEEMKNRIAVHRAERPESWGTLEAPQQVGQSILKLDPRPDTILIDCMTLLVSNAILAQEDAENEMLAQAAVKSELEMLVSAYSRMDSNWIVVSNEVGLGLVPEYRLGRIYRDCLGRTNQELARIADTVLFLVAGIPMAFKGRIPVL